MKKALLFASLIGASLFANAQVSFGPKVGLGFSNYRYKIAESGEISTVPASQAVFSPVLGVAMNIKFGDYFALQPGLQYAMMGSKQDLTIFGTTIKSKTSTHNIQIPVLIKVQYPISDNFALGLGVGPYVGFMLGGKSKTEASGKTETTTIKGKAKVEAADYEKENTSYMNPLDFGLSIAPYVEISNFQIALAYNLGLADLSSKYDGKSTTGLKTYNNWYGLSLAYFFGDK